MLKSYIAIFSTINTKNHAAMVEGKQKNLAVVLQCTTKYGCALAKKLKRKNNILLKVILFCCVSGGGCCIL